MKRFLILVVLVVLVASCTENQQARQFGGTSTIALPAGQKLVNATWKDHDLWYLTRPMEEGETPTTWKFQEDSSFGMMEGTIIFVEKE